MSDSELTLAALALARRAFPTADAAYAEVARLGAQLLSPKPTVHVVSDIHGEHEKLRHIVNNASGALRPLIEGVFGARYDAERLARVVALVFYPSETIARLAPPADAGEERARFLTRALADVLEVLRAVARGASVRRLDRALPSDYGSLLRELMFDGAPEGQDERLGAIVRRLMPGARATRLIRLAARMARDLAVDELVVAGDCWDRGPRGDRVLDILLAQPSVHFTWGNHDAAWLGAALGSEALICHVLRISARYGRLAQLEEGYGITLQPLEKLARELYATDPAERWRARNDDLRDPVTVARMHKAAAVMQHKLEAQLIARNPSFGLEHRRLMAAVELPAGMVTIDGRRHALADAVLPTVDPADPTRLSDAETACLARIRESFLASEKLWRHARELARLGALWLVRDAHLIFHGCLPVDEAGEPLAFEIDGQLARGRALFEAFERVVRRAVERPSEPDLDLLHYLWCGPRSPCFGKDRITTFERDFVQDPSTHVEVKNPYFSLIHERAFCERVLREFGVEPTQGLIVNGHVPVRIEAGESPLKESGLAITIDGAFSEAYGDHGYTLVLDARGTHLAKHHHFESVDAAIDSGVDIIPEVNAIRRFHEPRRVGDTEQGRVLEARISLLERLIDEGSAPRVGG
ncbi:MAG: fructose-bisphosphatase class III [Sorangiineae bacterium]|nr:fructose-bisphosphatase class III [Polyangiaceae bacterium]MEB2323390.1 fructose-bisphosphatase class III [Sorangiineae bacterium]